MYKKVSIHKMNRFKIIKNKVVNPIIRNPGDN